MKNKDKLSEKLICLRKMAYFEKDHMWELKLRLKNDSQCFWQKKESLLCAHWRIKRLNLDTWESSSRSIDGIPTFWSVKIQSFYQSDGEHFKQFLYSWQTMLETGNECLNIHLSLVIAMLCVMVLCILLEQALLESEILMIKRVILELLRMELWLSSINLISCKRR